ncbi:MAG: hypothetical protein ACLQVK_17460 [Acidimicrobiales bacterium]
MIEKAGIVATGDWHWASSPPSSTKERLGSTTEADPSFLATPVRASVAPGRLGQRPRAWPTRPLEPRWLRLISDYTVDSDARAPERAERLPAFS